MTGRDLIIYILQNNLEDEEIYKNGNIIGFMTDVDAAVKFGVGVRTVQLWVGLGQLDGITVGKQLYIPANAESPLSKGDTNVKTNDSSIVAVFNDGNG